MKPKERSLSQNSTSIGPHVGMSLADVVEKLEGVTGKTLRLGMREGLDISVYDLIAEQLSSQKVASEPCVTINILLEGQGTGEVLATDCRPVPFESNYLFITVMNRPVECVSTIPAHSRYKGVDLRLSHEFIGKQRGFPDLSKLDSSHRFHFSSSVGLWIGIAPIVDSIKSMAMLIFEEAFLSEPDDLLLESNALQILNSVLASLKPEAQQDGRTITKVLITAREERLLRSARAALLEKLGNAWTISTLAKLIGLNEKKLKSGFKHLFGKSIIQFLQYERLFHARSLLLAEQASVAEVSLLVGYANPSHFAYLFKRQFNCSPSDMKHQSRS